MNILLTGAFPYTDKQLEEISELGAVHFHQHESEPVPHAYKYDVVVCNNLFLYNAIEQFTGLKLIQLTSAGYDRISREYCANMNIIVQNAKGVYSIPMAEWAILKILELYKHSSYFYKNQEKKIWQKNRNLFELYNKTAAVIGFGSVGHEIAKRLHAFSADVLAVDIYMVDTPYNSKSYLIDEIEKPLAVSDIVILCLPLTEKTRYLFSDALFEKMKNGSILINLSRGAVIKESALIRQIEKNRFRGVALDVFEQEPLLPQSKLWDFENVLITPHNSFVSEAVNDRLYALIANNLKAFCSGIFQEGTNT